MSEVTSGNPQCGDEPQQVAATPWYLLYSKPKQEELVTIQLRQQGYSVFLPRYKKLIARTAEKMVAFEPMFPRYVFFRPAGPGQSISAARSSRGAANLVSFGGKPAIVTEETISTIREFESQRNLADVADISPFQPGEEVRLRNSPLNGVSGLVAKVSSRRVEVLLQLLGRQKIVSVSHQQLELA